MTINNPGEAMRLVQAVLRQNGFTTDRVKAHLDDDEWFEVVGDLVRESDLMSLNQFRAAVAEDGTYRVHSGAFGIITNDGDDPFTDL